MSDFPFAELEADPDAIARFVEAENARTAAAYKTDRFYTDVDRIAAILENPSKLGGLTRRGNWLYTFRQTADNPRGLWLRRPDGDKIEAETGWETVFDVDAFCLQTGGDWHWRGAETAWFDPDRVLLMLSQGGSDQKRILEFDCTTRAPVPGGFDLGPSRCNATWLDADTLLWSSAEPGDATRASWPGTIRRLTRDGGKANASQIFRADPDDLLAHGYVVLDPSGAPILCHSRIPEIGHEEATVFLPEGPVTLPNPIDTNVVNTARHYAYVVKTTGGAQGALMLGEIGAPAREIWRPGPRQSVDTSSLRLLDNWLLWIEKDGLTPRLRALSLEHPNARPQDIAPPESAEMLWLGRLDSGYRIDAGRSTAPLVLHLQGFLQPSSSYLFDLENGPDGISFTRLWQDPEEFDASTHKVELREAISDDGTAVPYHLVRPKGAGPVPTMLYGYGGFAISLTPHYSPLLGQLWLERGGAYALAHIRGGGELGPDWHLVAKGANRPRAFEDFAAIARDLSEQGLATPAQIGGHGGSNGGLLTGVMLNRYPELFGAIWSSVGVYDMLRFHVFPAGRGWIDEYGDPDDPEASKWLRGYSPLHTIPTPETDLPAALITTSDNDDRVDPSHARRYAAALKKAGHTPFFFQHDGGHGGGGSSRARAAEQALGYGFLAHHLGLT